MKQAIDKSTLVCPQPCNGKEVLRPAGFQVVGK